MFKKKLKKYLSSPDSLAQNKSMKIFGHILQRGYLWRINRNSITRATGIGLFCAFIPVPFQMVVAAIFAILFYANLPLSVALVWLTNPLTIPPIFYFCYKVGAFILNTPEKAFSIELSYEWLCEQFLHIWQPLLLGSFLCGTIAAAIGYFGVGFLWRFNIIRHRKRRQQSI